MKKNRLWWFMAWRFFRARNKTQVVNILTYLSIAAVATLIAAFIIIVSVFNGFDQHFKELYSSLYPDFAIQSRDGQEFPMDEKLQNFLQSQKGIRYSRVLDTKAFVQYRDRQSILKVRAVDSTFTSILGLELTTPYEDHDLEVNRQFACYYSSNTGQALGLNVNFDLIPIEVSIPKNTKSKLAIDQVSTGYLYPKGTYFTEESQAEKEMIAPYDYIAALSSQEGLLSEVAIGGDQEALEAFEKNFNNSFPDLELLSKSEQNESLFKIVNTERSVVYIILIFMLLLSSLNIIGVLLMTIIEKKKDISLMRGLGASKQNIQTVFLNLGVLIGTMGVLIGLLIGLTFAYGQQNFGWIMMNTSNLLNEPFPVEVKVPNILFIAVLGVVIALLASWIPSRYVDTSTSHLKSMD